MTASPRTPLQKSRPESPAYAPYRAPHTPPVELPRERLSAAIPPRLTHADAHTRTNARTNTHTHARTSARTGRATPPSIAAPPARRAPAPREAASPPHSTAGHALIRPCAHVPMRPSAWGTPTQADRRMPGPCIFTPVHEKAACASRRTRRKLVLIYQLHIIYI
jgi:hypothetical protein